MTEINGKDYLTPNRKIEGNKKVNKYVPPIVYYNTSNPYATTYYANGYEYVPNYIPPVIYYAPTYDGGYSYYGGNSYSGGNGYSSRGSNTNVESPNNGNLSQPSINHNVNYGRALPDTGDGDEDLGKDFVENYAISGWEYGLGRTLENVYDTTPIGVGIDFGTQLMNGESIEEAGVKTIAHKVISEASIEAGAELGGEIGTLGGPVGIVVGVGIGIAVGVIGGMLFDATYDWFKRRKW